MTDPLRNHQIDQPQIDWSLGTYEGARREQIRRWSQLSLTQVIQALEDMEQLAIRFGSMPSHNPLHMLETAVAVCTSLNVRAVVLAGWSQLQSDPACIALIRFVSAS